MLLATFGVALWQIARASNGATDGGRENVPQLLLEIELTGALPWRRARREIDRPIEDDDPGRRAPV